VGRLLAVTGGHRFDADAFESMLDAIADELGWEWVHEPQPDAQRWLRPEHAGVWDAIVLYDIPGLELRRGSVPRPIPPSDDVRDGVIELLRRGQGIVALHHALAGWPAWDDWAECLGGRFAYAPGTLRGREIAASGYRMDRYAVEVVASEHPVCEGVDAFEVDDELYLCPVFEDEVTPLLRTPAALEADLMLDTLREVVDDVRTAATPQPASQLVGWCREHGPSRIVYLLPGHGPSTMGDRTYRHLLANACRWVARPQEA
jgi:type 1 glutamine amidotransferase